MFGIYLTVEILPSLKNTVDKVFRVQIYDIMVNCNLQNNRYGAGPPRIRRLKLVTVLKKNRARKENSMLFDTELYTLYLDADPPTEPLNKSSALKSREW